MDPAADPDLVTRAVGEEVLVYDTVTDEVHALSGERARLWQSSDDALTRRRLLTRGAVLGAATVGGIATLAAPAAAVGLSQGSTTFSTPGGPTTYEVPTGITILSVILSGGAGGTGQGGPLGGTGYSYATTLTVPPGTTSLQVYVGDMGLSSSGNSNGVKPETAGYGTGGGNGDSHGPNLAGSGGGGSAILTSGGTALLIAGGGGGGGFSDDGSGVGGVGGNAGGASGTAGGDGTFDGQVSAGGAGGSASTGSGTMNGQNANATPGGKGAGGGGGGLYGGGAGLEIAVFHNGDGGGGGGGAASLTAPPIGYTATGTTVNAGNTGAGSVTISAVG